MAARSGRDALLTREGSVFHAKEPAPIGLVYEIELRVYDLCGRFALRRICPTKLAAGHFASVCGTFIGGTHPDTGRQYTIVEPQIGGWGRAASAMAIRRCSAASTARDHNCPALRSTRAQRRFVDQMTLNVEPAAGGEHTGGRGIVMDYRLRADSSFLTAGYTRSKFPPGVSMRGNDGSPNYIEFRPKGHAAALCLCLGLVQYR